MTVTTPPVPSVLVTVWKLVGVGADVMRELADVVGAVVGGGTLVVLLALVVGAVVGAAEEEEDELVLVSAG